MSPMKIPLKIRKWTHAEAVEQTIAVDAARIAIVIVDMWHYHWCRTWVGRAGALIPRMNKALSVARKLGITVIHAPTDVVTAYAGYEQRERMAALDDMPFEPAGRVISVYPPEELSNGKLHPQYYDGEMCGSPFPCIENFGMYKLDPRLDIHETDWISASARDVNNLCKRDGIEHLIYFGGATNICILGKLEGMIQMSALGFDCMIARDLTEAHSDGAGSAGLDHNTERAVQFIETHIGTSIDFGATMRELGQWEESWIVDSVLIAPWGRQSHPQFFEDAIAVTMTCPRLPGAEIRYTLDGSEPAADSALYAGELRLANSVLLRAAAFRGGSRISLVSESHYTKIPPAPPVPDVFLSDLQPKYAALPGYIPWWSAPEKGSDPPPAMDSSYDGTPLVLRGERYGKGIGVNTPSQLVYRLDPAYEYFVAGAGICESLLDRDNGRAMAVFPRATFKVFVDGKPLAESKCMYISEVPWRFKVKIPEGSRSISLVTTTEMEGASYNLANWANAGFLLHGTAADKGAQRG